MREIVVFVCAVMVVDGVVLAAPVCVGREFEGADIVDADGAEIIETTGEVVL